MRWGLVTVLAGCLWGLATCGAGGRNTQQHLAMWGGQPTPRVTGRPPAPRPTRKVAEEAGPGPGRPRKAPKTTPSSLPAKASDQCVVNGLVLYQGAVWSPRPCTVCVCEEGKVVCEDIECPATKCRRKRRPPGRCCLVCAADSIQDDTALVSQDLEAAPRGKRQRLPADRKEGKGGSKDGRKSNGGTGKESAHLTGKQEVAPEQEGGRQQERSTKKQELRVQKPDLRKKPQLGLQKQGMVIGEQEMVPMKQEAGPKKQEMVPKKQEMVLKKQEMVPKKQEAGLKKQEMVPMKQEMVPKKQEAGLKKQEAGLKKQEMVPKKQEMVPMKQEMVPKKQEMVPKKQEAGLKKQEAGLKKQDVGLKKQDVGLKKQEVGFKKQEAGFKKREVGLKKHEAGPKKQEAGPQASTKKQALVPKKQEIVPKRQEVNSEAEHKKREVTAEESTKRQGSAGRGAAKTQPRKPAGPGKDEGEARSATTTGNATAASAPYPEELLPPPESEFRMPSLPAGCILAETAIACPAAHLTEIPTLVDPGLHTLYLADNDITTISASAFSGLPNLQWLDLSRNKVGDEGLDPDAFRNLTRLRRLNLDGNRICGIPRLPTTLEELKMNDNCVEVTDRQSFRGLHRLLTLELEGNGLNDGNVNPSSLRPLRRLTYLRLGRNRFRAMPSGLPSSLQELHLENNHIEEVPGGLLNKTLNLTVLVLRNNRIQENRIAPRAWIHLRKLESLDLSHNRMVHVPSFLPTGLKVLLLHHNQIERIPGYVFAHLKPGLEFLHLSYNRLSDDGIHGNSFLGLYRSLQELLLDHNHLRAVPRGILNLQVLQVLRLSDNQIRYIPLDSVCDTRVSEDSNLVSIHLENNLIDRRMIPPTAFSCIRSYQSIVLRPQRFED